MSEAPPDLTAAAGRGDSAAVRIVNRSTFWSTAFHVSALCFVGHGGAGIGLLLGEYGIVGRGTGGYLFFAIPSFIGGMGLMLLPFPDTVDWITLGDTLQLKRIFRRRTILPDRVVRVEFARPKGEDYDEEQFALRYVELRIHIRGVWPAWLLVTHGDAATVRAWAVAHGRPIVDRTG